MLILILIKMTKEKIQEEVDSIRESCDEIEGVIKPKRVKTRGDPIVELH